MLFRSASISSKKLVNLLERHDWPGNIRELENAIKRFVILGSEDALYKTVKSDGAEDNSETTIPPGAVSLKELTRQAVRQVEKRVILSTLEAKRWNRRAVSRALGISYAALLYKMREAGVPARQVRCNSELGASKFGQALSGNDCPEVRFRRTSNEGVK